MHAKHTLVLLAATAVIGPTSAVAQDRARVATECKPAGDRFAYDCTFKLTNARTGAALDGAEVSVGADMPSMPMAHNVRPVTTKPTGKPGEYAARLSLEMYGDWTVRVRVSGPIRDEIVDLKNFSDQGSGPPSKRAGARKDGGHKH